MRQRQEIQEVPWTLERRAHARRSSFVTSWIQGGVFDHVTKRHELKGLEAKTTASGFWDDQKSARNTMKTLHRVQDEVSAWDELEGDASDLAEIAESIVNGDDGLLKEVESHLEEVSSRLEDRRFELMLGGNFDGSDAILSVHSGAGGTESQDWAEMLLRMYQRWGEQRSYDVELLDLSPGEEAGIKSATLQLSGPYAYGYLRSEVGVHRLVRISPFDAGNRRHTSFAKIEILPVIEDDVDYELDPSDVRVDTFRASGAGGQHVNKTESAVRVTHIPTGLMATCRSQRSQIRNREVAWTILTARVADLKRAEADARKAALKGENINADFGNQIRSYVLQPYRQVKDVRTGHETSDTVGVLDGDLDPFIHAFLQSRVVASDSG